MSRWTLEDCNSINTKFLKDYGYLEHGVYRNGTICWLWNGEEIGSVGLSVNYDNSKVYFNYISTDHFSEEKINKNYLVNLLKTPCQYGGFRYWFECPFCYQRMGCLFLYNEIIQRGIVSGLDYTCNLPDIIINIVISK